MNDFKNRSFFHDGMREFQNLLTAAGQLKQLKKIENITNFGTMKKT